ANNSKADRTSLNRDNDGKYAKFDSLYSNNYSFEYGTHSGGLNFRFNGNKLVASFGSNIANANFKQTDLLRDSLYRYHFVNLFPKAMVRFKMGAQTGLTIRYNGYTQQPTIQQLQPVIDNTDNLNVSVGNPNLRQQFTNTFNLFFNDYKVMSGRNIYISADFSQSDNAIAGYDAVEKGKRTYTYVNVDGNMTYGVWGGYWKQFKKPKLNVNANLQFNGGRINNFINTLRNTNNYYTFGPRAGLMKDKENKYSVELNVNPSRTWSRSSLRPDVVTKYWTVEYGADVRYQLKWKLELHSDAHYYWRETTDVFGQNRNVFIWNAWVAKKFWKNNNGELRFSINDILNQNIGFQRNASSNFISERTYSTLKRYWLVSFAWNFTKNPGTK
ncbi:MAG: outer membrane beta-barrel protein, partial [Flavihumibacter sp.]